MSKGTGYIMLDKYLAQAFKEIHMEFSVIEAMFSYTLDQDNGVKGSIKGYAALWGWSRNRVRRFLKLIRTPYGHPGDTRRTPYGHPIHFIDKCLWLEKDTLRTVKGHPTDTLRTPTTNPNPNPNPNPKEEIPPLPPKPKKKKAVFTPPTKEDVIKYFIENEYDGNKGAEAFEFYDCADWFDSRGNKVKNWKQKMRGVWFKDDNRVVKNKMNGGTPTMSTGDQWIQMRRDRENANK